MYLLSANNQLNNCIPYSMVKTLDKTENAFKVNTDSYLYE